MQHPNNGNAAAAMPKVHNAVQMLQDALPAVPMGTELHTAILKAIESISKHMSQNDQSQGLDMQSMIQMMKNASQQAPMQALARMYPSGGGAGPAMPGAGGPPGAPPG
jgi:hypothetical protein